MQAYPVEVGNDAGGPFANVGIFPDGVDPTAKDAHGIPLHQPIEEPFTVRPVLPDDYEGTEEMSEQDRATHVAQAMFERGVEMARVRIEELAHHQALAQAAASVVTGPVQL